MTTIPVQRGPESDGTGRVLGYIAEAVRRLDDSVERGFEGIRRELAELPRHYVPRLEIDRRFDELGLDVRERGIAHDRAIAELAARHDRDVSGLRQRADAEQKAREDDAKAREEREREDARERATARRWLVGLAITGAMSATGVVSGIVLHFT